MSESHADQTVIHIPFAAVYADAAARAAATGFPRGVGAAIVPFAASDVGKVVWQEDDDSIWLLTAVTPTWLQIDGVGWAAALAAHVAAADPHVGYQKESEKGVAGGYASLDGGGLIPITQLPALAINDTFPVADQAAMLALTAQRGDVAIRADNGNTYILSTDSPGTLADWKQITISGGTPGSHASTHENGGGDEISVAGLSGVLTDPQVPITENVQDIVGAMLVGGAYDDTAGTLTVGYLNIPQNSQSVDYTAVLTDQAKHLFHPVGDNNPRTFTIPANASVAYPIGTALTFVNKINALTIAITTDTLTWAEDGSTGSRTLAANGMATALKITATEWLISGTGLS